MKYEKLSSANGLESTKYTEWRLHRVHPHERGILLFQDYSGYFFWKDGQGILLI